MFLKNKLDLLSNLPLFSRFISNKASKLFRITAIYRITVSGLPDDYKVQRQTDIRTDLLRVFQDFVGFSHLSTGCRVFGLTRRVTSLGFEHSIELTQVIIGDSDVIANIKVLTEADAIRILAILSRDDRFLIKETLHTARLDFAGVTFSGIKAVKGIVPFSAIDLSPDGKRNYSTGAFVGSTGLVSKKGFLRSLLFQTFIGFIFTLIGAFIVLYLGYFGSMLVLIDNTFALFKGISTIRIPLVICVILVFIAFLLSVAFSTVTERQVIASIQRRSGPSVVGIFGTLQAFADGAKLALKEPILPALSASGLFVVAPILGFVVCSTGFCLLFHSDSSFQGLIFVALSSLGVYSVLFAGWSSNSKYAFLGCLRSVAQIISYELGFGVCILCVGIFSCDPTGIKCLSFYEIDFNLAAIFPVSVLFFICALGELKRVPFDLSEAEAELVAGFNVEYSSLGFALFFIAEYANIAVISALASIYFLGGFSAFKLTAIIFIFIWIRGTLPRYRYDSFMRLGWKALLPLSLSLYALYACFDYIC